MASPPATRPKKLVPSTTPKYWKGKSCLPSLQGTRNKKGYDRDSDAESLAVIGRYESLKNCRDCEKCKQRTKPIFRLKTNVLQDLPDWTDSWNVECKGRSIEMGLFFELSFDFVALGRSREIGSGLQSQGPWVFLLIPTIMNRALRL